MHSVMSGIRSIALNALGHALMASAYRGAETRAIRVVNMVADRTREGSHQATTSELWVTVASAPSGRGHERRRFQVVSTPLAPPRVCAPAVEYTTGSAGRNTRVVTTEDEKGPGLQHASYPGRPTKQTVSFPRKRRRSAAVRTAEGVDPRLWTTPLGSRPRSTVQQGA